jgi:hypothetical protein
MSDIKGGKGLHGPDKQQDALRDVRSGAYDKGGPSKAPHPNEGQRTEHQRAQWGADVRQGVPDAHTVHTEESDLPEGVVSQKNGPLGQEYRTRRRVARASASLGAVEQPPKVKRCLGSGTRVQPHR